MRYSTFRIILVALLFAGCGWQVEISDLDQARIHFRESRWDKVLQSCKVAIRNNPDNGEAYLLRGRAQMAKGDLDSAIKSFSEASRVNPDVPESYHYRAAAYRQQGKLALARADKRRARHVDKDYDRAFLFKPEEERPLVFVDPGPADQTGEETTIEDGEGVESDGQQWNPLEKRLKIIKKRRAAERKSLTTDSAPDAVLAPGQPPTEGAFGAELPGRPIPGLYPESRIVPDGLSDGNPPGETEDVVVPEQGKSEEESGDSLDDAPEGPKGFPRPDREPLWPGSFPQFNPAERFTVPYYGRAPPLDRRPRRIRSTGIQSGSSAPGLNAGPLGGSTGRTRPIHTGIRSSEIRTGALGPSAGKIGLPSSGRVGAPAGGLGVPGVGSTFKRRIPFPQNNARSTGIQSGLDR